MFLLVYPLERVPDNLHRYNLLDLRRVDVHFHQLVVVSLILWLTLRIGSLALIQEISAARSHLSDRC